MKFNAQLEITNKDGSQPEDPAVIEEYLTRLLGTVSYGYMETETNEIVLLDTKVLSVDAEEDLS